jgi:hemerythrin-like domain-containing protein
MELLFEEHATILDAVSSVKAARAWLEADPLFYEQTIRSLIAFFRDYADRYHHSKEEEILFPEMCRRNELLAGGVIHEMLDNHDTFRQMLSEIEASLAQKKYGAAQHQIEEYAEALSDHIAVENEEVFQAAASLFTDAELEKIRFRFLDSDRDLGTGRKEELENSARSLQSALMSR